MKIRINNNTEKQVNTQISNSTQLREIRGRVYDICGKPIANACIKALDCNYTPLVHTITDPCGNFTLLVTPKIPLQLVIAKNGYRTENIKNCNEYLNITLHNENKNSLVIGQVFPIFEYSSPCSLLLANKQNSYRTFCDKCGNFSFNDIPQGKYNLTITGNEIKKRTLCLNISSAKNLIQLGKIKVCPINIKGTIHGIITNECGQVVENSFIVLYNAINNTPIASTKTNQEGLYFFGSVPRGEYYIKAY